MNELPDASMAALRRLARGLLYDRDRAQDLVQEAWLAALRKHPPESGLFGWLAGATRRLARDARREEARRSEREARAARSEKLPGADEVAGRIEVLHRVLDAVNALEEPYKSAVALRYLDDLPPREIAKRQGVPVNTVRTHVRRGLERLRRQLEGERGRKGQDLLAVLAPLAGKVPWGVALGLPPSPLAVSTAGGLLVKHKAVLTLFLVLLLGSSWFVFRALGEPEARAREELSLAVPAGAEPAAATPELAVEPVSGSTSERAPLSSFDAPANPTWIVRGHVTRGEWEPYPRARLVGRVHEGGAWYGVKPSGTTLYEQRFLADERGDFAWAIDPPSRLLTVFVEPDIEDHKTTSTGDTFLPGDPAPDKFRVSATPLDCTLRGVVRDAEGRPVEGVRVSPEVTEYLTTTGEDGRYALRVPSLSEIDLQFVASGFARTLLEVGLPAAGDVEVPEVILEPELRVQGRVVDEHGEPVPGARVCPTPSALHADLATTTDENGRFDLGMLDPDEREVRISVNKSGYLEANRLFPVIDGQPLPDVRIELARGIPVTGRVLSLDGKPVEGTWISVGSHYAEPRNDTRSDANGRFVFASVPRGVQQFWFWRAGFAHLRQEIEIPQGVGSLDGLEIVLRKSHFVGGIVLGDDGKPLPWARVSADDPESPADIEGFWTYAGADGRFRMDGFPEMSLLLTATASGHLRLRQEVLGLDRDDLVLQLARSASLAGLVVDAASGAPLDSFTVHAFQLPSPTSSASQCSSRTFRGVRGTWSIRVEIDPGRAFAVMVTAPGREPAFACEVSPSFEPRPRDLVLRLRPGASVVGTVVDAVDRKPVANVKVRCSGEPGCPRFPDLVHAPEVRTDADGRFRIDGLSPGKAFIVAQPEPARSIGGELFIEGLSGRTMLTVSGPDAASSGSAEVFLPEQGELNVVVELRAR